MLNELYTKTKIYFRDLLSGFNESKTQLKNQYPYEVFDISFEPKKNKHRIEVKLSGKALSDFFWAEDLASSKKYLEKFSPKDLQTITYLATCDHFSNKIFEPMYRIFRVNSSKNSKKKIGIENIFTGKKEIKGIDEITANSDFLTRMHFLDVFQIGYLIGQEQAKKNAKLVNKDISSNKDCKILPLNSNGISEKSKNSLLDGNIIESQKSDTEEMDDYDSYRDKFSYKASEYSIYRPTYPVSLFLYLSTLTNSSSIAIDCGAGSGQATEGLANFYKNVISIDFSYELLSKSESFNNVIKIHASADHIPIKTHSVDLVCSAQAVHWFNLEKFYSEAKRVLKKQGIIAVWCYNQASINKKIDAVVAKIYEKVRCDENFSIEKQYVHENYENLPFPFKKIESPQFNIVVEWSFNEWIGYIKTWPSILSYKKKFDVDLVDNFQLALRHSWGVDSTKKINWQIHLLVGQVDA